MGIRVEWADVNRRSFVGYVSWGLATLCLRPASTTAKQSVRRIGVLSILPRPSAEELQGAWEPLRPFGWVQDRDFVVDRRYAGGDPILLQVSAGELVRLGVDVILTIGTEAALAALAATHRIPIVMVQVGDPVGTGLVKELSHPGGNVTGFSSAFPELDAKRASLLRELVPGIEQVGVIFNPANPLFRLDRPRSEASYRSLGINSSFVEATSAEQVVDAIAHLSRQRAQAVVILADAKLYADPTSSMKAAQLHALPTVVQGRYMVEAGGLLSYEANVAEQGIRVSATIDKVLRGVRPQDIPVELPSRYDLIVNRGTARKLRLTIPHSLLLRADEVIQ